MHMQSVHALCPCAQQKHAHAVCACNKQQACTCSVSMPCVYARNKHAHAVSQNLAGCVHGPLQISHAVQCVDGTATEAAASCPPLHSSMQMSEGGRELVWSHAGAHNPVSDAAVHPLGCIQVWLGECWWQTNLHSRLTKLVLVCPCSICSSTCKRSFHYSQLSPLCRGKVCQR